MRARPFTSIDVGGVTDIGGVGLPVAAAMGTWFLGLGLGEERGSGRILWEAVAQFQAISTPLDLVASIMADFTPKTGVRSMLQRATLSLLLIFAGLLQLRALVQPRAHIAYWPSCRKVLKHDGDGYAHRKASRTRSFNAGGEERAYIKTKTYGATCTCVYGLGMPLD